MFDLVTFGETLVRLSPPGPQVIEQSRALDMYAAGSELNAAAAASRLGLETAYMTRLAKNPLGKFVAGQVRAQGVDTRFIQWSDTDRQGLYFFEGGSLPRPGVAYYDRKESAFSRLNASDVDWTAIMNSCRVFHSSGINPALSLSVRAASEQAIKAAREAGCIVSFDVNYRSKLWSVDEAASVIEPLIADVDILFVSAGDAASVLRCREPQGQAMAEDLAQRFGIPTVNLIYHEADSDSLWEIVCLHQGTSYRWSEKRQTRTVDRLGSGDSYAGGFLAGYLTDGVEAGVAYGNAMMMLKTTYLGDFNWADAEMVQAFIEAGDLGQVQR